MSSHHGLYAQGYTRATMERTKGCYLVTGCQSQKPLLSSDWSLQLDSMKLESLVSYISNDTVNTFPDLVHTARQAMEAGCT